MSSRNNQKWGAGLMALSRGLGDWQAENERKRRQEELRAQQLDDLNTQNLRFDQLLKDKYAREDEINLQENGPILPAYQKPTNAYSGLDPLAAIGYASGLQFPEPAPQTPVQYYGGLQMPSELVGGMRAKPAVGMWDDLNQRIKPIADPNLGKVRVVDKQGREYWMSPGDAYNANNPKPTTPTDALYPVDIPVGAPGFPAGGQVNAESGQVASLINALSPDSGGGLSPAQLVEAENGLLGGRVAKGAYDEDSGTGVPYDYAVPGSLWNQVKAPIDILDRIERAKAEARAAGKPLITPDLANAALAAILQDYDMKKAQAMDDQVTSEFAIWKPSTKKDKTVPGQYQLETNNKKDPIRKWVEFYADVVEKQLADGADEIEWNTIHAWLAKNKLTYNEVAPYIDAAISAGFQIQTDEKY